MTIKKQEGFDQNVSEREMARKNAKPRSARETMKGPNDKKGSTSRKSGKRSPK
jgi:hypothetical protein